MNTNFLNSVTNFLKKRTFELVGLLLIFIGIALSVSFITYSPNDPSFVYGESNTNIKNFFGKPIIAYSICGYIFSVIFFLLAINYERVQQLNAYSFQFTANHSFLICSGTILSSLIFPVLFIFTLNSDTNLPLINPVALI